MFIFKGKVVPLVVFKGKVVPLVVFLIIQLGILFIDLPVFLSSIHYPCSSYVLLIQIKLFSPGLASYTAVNQFLLLCFIFPAFFQGNIVSLDVFMSEVMLLVKFQTSILL